VDSGSVWVCWVETVWEVFFFFSIFGQTLITTIHCEIRAKRSRRKKIKRRDKEDRR
jgi:hypothetical protein